MPGLTGPARILQVHVTRRCNLRCLHCYSDSSPEAADELPLEVAARVVEDAARLGYDVLSVSGGEPFLYRPLLTVLDAARRAGMRTQVVSNGLLLGVERLRELQPVLDLLVISVDGEAADHDHMRGRVGAAAALERGLAVLRDSGVRWGLLFTLTAWNVHQLAWAADLARRNGAALLQVHPLEASGRAKAMIADVPDATEACFALLEAARLRRTYGDALAIHVDVGTVADLRTALATGTHLVSPLVVEPDGTCVPLEYGFPRDFALGNVAEERLSELAPRWLADVAPRLAIAMDAAADGLPEDADAIVVNLYERVRLASSAVPVSLSARTARSTRSTRSADHAVAVELVDLGG